MPQKLRQKLFNIVVPGYEDIIVGDVLVVSAVTGSSLNVLQNGVLVAGSVAATAAYVWGVRRFADWAYRRAKPRQDRTSAGADTQEMGAHESRKSVKRLLSLAPGIGMFGYAIASIMGGMSSPGPQADRVFFSILLMALLLNVCILLQLQRLTRGGEFGRRLSKLGDWLRIAVVCVTLTFGIAAVTGGNAAERIMRATMLMTAALYNFRFFWGGARQKFDEALDEIGSYLKEVTTDSESTTQTSGETRQS